MSDEIRIIMATAGIILGIVGISVSVWALRLNMRIKRRIENL